MCGIVGEIGTTRITTSEATERIGALAALMQRRGPDDGGVWSDAERCTLGFRRLAILDLTPAGHQPMLSPCGRFALVFNGEVYNFATLRRELEQDGTRFRSTGDAEVVLHSLARWGVRALDRFNGMFALAFYDATERRLLLARDHAGIKPLYYARTPSGLVFASQYDQIVAHPWCRGLRPSADAIGQYLRFGYVPAPLAALEGTHMLEPGSWLTVTASGNTAGGRYYAFPQNPDPTLRGREAHEAVAAAVEAAVRRQLVSDVAIGTFLSGGIDSPLVAATARRAFSARLRAYTIGTGGGTLDESDDAAAYAARLDLDHQIEHATAADALALVEEAIGASTEPFADYSIIPTMLVSRLAARDVTVVLSGDGGDELFWGYAQRFGSVLRHASRFARPFWSRTAERGLHRLTGLGEWQSYRLMRSIGHWYGVKHSKISDAWLPRLFPGPHERFRLPQSFEFSGHRQDDVAHWMRWNEFVNHLTMVLLKVDRASMHHSIEVRVPLLDREVVDVATRVDWTTCLDLDADVGKLPLRSALSSHVERQTMAKRGFAVPIDEWMRTSLRPMLEDTLTGRDEIAGVALDPRALRVMLDEQRRGASLGAGLWSLLTLARWEDTYLRRTTFARPSVGRAARPLAIAR